MGLGKIFIFSLLSGISFSFSLTSSSDSSGVGFGFFPLEILNNIDDSQIQAFVTIASIIITIILIYRLSKFMSQVFDERQAGILVAVLGFSGSVSIFFSSAQENYLIWTGIGLWILGIIIIILRQIK